MNGIQFIDRYRRNGLPDMPLVISGPCSAESEEQVLKTAEQLASSGVDIFRAGIWKPRTKPGSFEGMGEKALPWLASVRRLYGMSTGTEVATPYHVEKVLEAGIDMLWIGARTTANPFAVQEISESLRGVDIPVFVKNPVSPDLELWIGAVERLVRCGVREIGAIHRGFSSFGASVYRNMPYWSIPMEFHRRMPELPLICDPSHIAGKRELVVSLAVSALNMGFDGLFIESHCNPECALSDASQQLEPKELKEFIDSIKPLKNRSYDSAILSYRKDIDSIDEQILSLLSKRMEISAAIGRYKADNSISVFQSDRYEQIIRDRCSFGRELDLNDDFVVKIMRAIHEESVRIQIELKKKDK